MRVPLKNASHSLRIAVVLIALAAGFATHAYAETNTSQEPDQPTITLFEEVNHFKGPGIGQYTLASTDVKRASGDINEAVWLKSFGRKFINYDGTSDAPTITKLDGERNFKISIKSTIKNAGTLVLNGYMFFETFAPAGIKVNDVKFTALNSLTSLHHVHINPPGTYGTASPNGANDWINFVTNDVNSSLTLPGSTAPRFYPGSDLSYQIEVMVTVSPTATVSDLSCVGNESQNENFYYGNNPGRKGLILRSALNQEGTSEFGKVDLSTTGPGLSTETSRINARYCADFSSVVAPVVASTTATTVAVPTTVVAGATSIPQDAAPNVPDLDVAVETVPQHAKNLGSGGLGTSDPNKLLGETPAQSPTSNSLPKQSSKQLSDQLSEQGSRQGSQGESVQEPAGGQTPVNDSQPGDAPVDNSTDIVADVLERSGSYSPEAASGQNSSRGVNVNESADVVDGVLAQQDSPSGGSSSRNIEYAIAGLLVLCAVGALMTNKKFGRPGMETDSVPRVTLSPSDALTTPRSLNSDPRLYNSDLHLVDFPEAERELELVGATSISSGASKAQTRARVFDATQHDRQTLPTRIWNELVSRLTKEHHNIQ